MQYTDSRAFTTHSWFCGANTVRSTVYIFPAFWLSAVSPWFAHYGLVLPQRIGEWIRFPCTLIVVGNNVKHNFDCTVGSKITRALEIILVKKLLHNAVL